MGSLSQKEYIKKSQNYSAIKKACLHCGKDFNKTTIYCSQKCYGESMKNNKRNKPHKNICIYCLKEFYSYKNKAKYCSPSCATKNYRKTHYKKIPKIKHVCKRCNKTFLGTNRKHDYCSTKCYHLDYYDPQIGKKGICKYCKKEFIKSKSYHVFCSVNCNNKCLLSKMTLQEKEERRKRMNYLYHKRNPRKTYTKECLCCNKNFLTTNKRKLYCCNNCSTKSYRKQPRVIALRRHESNKRRHQEKLLNCFTVEQWKEAKKYFKNRCAYCEKKARKLQQDHFIPLKSGGSYTQDNIIPACPSCNHSKNSKDPHKWIISKFINGKEIYKKVTQYLIQY